MTLLQKAVFSCGLCGVFILSCLVPNADGGRFHNYVDRFMRKFVNHPSDAGYSREIGSKITMEPGDTLVISVDFESKTVRRPWHWFYAITRNTALRFQPPMQTIIEKATPKLFDPAKRYPNYTMMNRRKKPRHIGLVGSLVALLMADHTLPFNFITCSPKHYVEYLSLGVVDGGRWYSPMYNVVSRRCPVRAKLDASMLPTIYRTKEFTLAPIVGPSITLKISSWPPEIESLVQEQLKRKSLSPQLSRNGRSI